MDENVLDVGADGSLIIYCRFEEKEIAKSVGARWDKPTKTWVTTFTPETVEFLVENLRDVSITDDVETKLSGLIEVNSRLNRLRKMAASDEPVRLNIPGFKGSLYNYQKLGVLYASAGMQGLLLGDEMGLGKSGQSIATACWKKSCGEMNYSSGVYGTTYDLTPNLKK